MIPLDDGYSKKLVLEHLLSWMETNIHNLLVNGLTPEALQTMRDRPALDLMRVAEMPQLEVKVHINPASLLSCFQRLDAMKRQQELKEYFVRHGATSEMLASLFKMPPAEVRAMRATLCKQQFGAGRPPMPDVEKRTEIHRCWIEITKQEQDIREQFYRLHQRFLSYHLSSLWSTICEFNRTSYRHEVHSDVKSATLLS